MSWCPHRPLPPCAAALALLVAAPANAGDADAAALHAAIAAERARPPAPRFERSDFIPEPIVHSTTLSPDGREVAYLVEQGTDRSVWLLPTAGGDARRLLSQTQAEQLSWSHDSRWLLLRTPRQLFALAAAGQAGSGIVTTLGGRERREFEAVDPVHPAAVIVTEQLPPGQRDASRQWRLVRVDVQGKRSVLHEDAHRISGFAFDSRGRLAYLQRVEGDALVIHRIDSQGGLHELVRCVKLERCALLPVVDDGDLLLRGDLRGSLNRLLRLDADGLVHTLHADPRGDADLDATVLDPVTGQPLIASYRSTVAANYGLTADERRHVDTIARRFPQRSLRIEVGRGNDARWLVSERGSSIQGARWHLYDPRIRRFRNILKDSQVSNRGTSPTRRLPESALARKIPFSWRATDGMRLHGFLSLPPGADPAHVPLVANVHGGPWSHTGPDYNFIVQLLANRGYAVVEPNFRGSTGYGRDYMLAAQGDFGNGRVQQDIVDGVHYLLSQGVGDPEQVGITGASFGGYSTLLGVTFAPELFKVGVAGVPPPDFAWDLRRVSRSSEALNLMTHGIPFRDSLRMLSLDLDDHPKMARLHAESPLVNAAELRRPLLMIASGKDRRVGISGVIAYAANLKLLEKNVSLLVDPDAGHSNHDPLARQAYLYLLELMLHLHLGGAAPSPPDQELRGYIERNLRISGRGLRER